MQLLDMYYDVYNYLNNSLPNYLIKSRATKNLKIIMQIPNLSKIVVKFMPTLIIPSFFCYLYVKKH